MSLNTRLHISGIVYSFLLCMMIFNYAEAASMDDIHLDFSNGWSVDFQADSTASSVYSYGNTMSDNNGVVPSEQYSYKNYELTLIDYGRHLFYGGSYDRQFRGSNCGWGGCYRTYNYKQDFIQLDYMFTYTPFDNIIDNLLAALDVTNAYQTFERKDITWNGNGTRTYDYTTLIGITVNGRDATVPEPTALLLIALGLLTFGYTTRKTATI